MKSLELFAPKASATEPRLEQNKLSLVFFAQSNNPLILVLELVGVVAIFVTLQYLGLAAISLAVG